MEQIKYIENKLRELINENINNNSLIIRNLMNDIRIRFNVELSLEYNKFANLIVLSKILINKEDRGKGIGSKVMSEICEFADNNKLRIALTPSSDFGGNKNRLIKFYKSFGFKPYRGYEVQETMIREPS